MLCQPEPSSVADTEEKGEESARLDVGVDKLSSVGVDTLFQVALQLVFFNRFTIIG